VTTVRTGGGAGLESSRCSSCLCCYPLCRIRASMPEEQPPIRPQSWTGDGQEATYYPATVPSTLHAPRSIQTIRGANPPYVNTYDTNERFTDLNQLKFWCYGLLGLSALILVSCWFDFLSSVSTSKLVALLIGVPCAAASIYLHHSHTQKVAAFAQDPMVPLL